MSCVLTSMLASRRCRRGLTFENSQRCGWTRECRVPSSAESGCESSRTGKSSQKILLQSIFIINALEHCAHRHRHFGTQTRRDCPRTVTTEWSLEVGIPLNPLNPPQTLSIPLRRPDLYHIAQRLAGSGAGEMTAEQHIDRILEERKQRKEAKKARKEAKRLKKRRAANSD